ncbi:MAG: helix-turn-helix domain-containing protein [Actinophytocola sp.]|nr:helix-turn-helix domain-containing protein [Actinophytocola sp.]
MTVLLREAIGDRLRHARTNQQRTLREISHSARVSLGYLSEVERGQKEASSELLAAICDALELPLPELLHTVASDMASVDDMVLDGASVAGSQHGDAASHVGTEAEAASSAASGGVSTALRTTIASPTVRVFAA